MLSTLLAWTIAAAFVIRVLALVPHSWRISVAHMAAFGSYEAGEWLVLGVSVILGLLSRWDPFWDAVAATEPAFRDEPDDYTPGANALGGGESA